MKKLIALAIVANVILWGALLVPTKPAVTLVDPNNRQELEGAIQKAIQTAAQRKEAPPPRPGTSPAQHPHLPILVDAGFSHGKMPRRTDD